MKIFTNNQKGESNLIQTIMVAALIVAAFFIGMLWTKVQSYEKGGSKAGTNAVNPTNNVAGGNPNGPAVPQVPTKIQLAPISDKDHVRGDNNARVALVEYSDLECPFCKTFHPTAIKLLSEYKDQVKWVFRHFPLDQLHSKARSEAAAAECAGILGGNDRFWDYIDKIYEITPSNNGLDPNQLPVVAGQIGLDVNKFKECQSGQDAPAAVTADYQSGIAAGINGTPGNILLDTKTGNTYEIPGAVPYDQLKQMVDNFIGGLQ